MLKQLSMRATARQFALVLIVVVAAVVGGAVGAGVGPSLTGAQTSGPISACVNNYTGALRVVYNTSQCGQSERPISWNEQGPGTITDIQVVSDNTVIYTEDATDSVHTSVDCPAGYVVVGGGAGLGTSSGSDTWTMTLSEPSSNEGWRAIFRTVDREDAVGQYIFFSDAICMKIA